MSMLSKRLQLKLISYIAWQNLKKIKRAVGISLLAMKIELIVL